MKDYELRFILEDKEKLVRLFAFKQGWQKEWLVQEQAAMESLYERKFDLLDTAIRVVSHKSYPVDDHSCLDHLFLQAFFAGFPKIEILQRPDLTFVSATVPPRMPEIYKYEEAWKHHIQVMVLLKPDERIEYLFSYVPHFLKEELHRRQDDMRKLSNKIRAERT